MDNFKFFHQNNTWFSDPSSSFYLAAVELEKHFPDTWGIELQNVIKKVTEDRFIYNSVSNLNDLQLTSIDISVYINKALEKVILKNDK